MHATHTALWATRLSHVASVNAALILSVLQVLQVSVGGMHFPHLKFFTSAKVVGRALQCKFGGFSLQAPTSKEHVSLRQCMHVVQSGAVHFGCEHSKHNVRRSAFLRFSHIPIVKFFSVFAKPHN